MVQKDSNDEINKKLDVIIELLQQSMALQLYKSGASKDVIRGHLHIARASVVKMLKGIGKEE